MCRVSNPKCTILRDDVQMCSECLISNAQSFGSELREIAESSATPEYTYTLAVASSAGACNKTMTRSVEIRRSYREFLHMIKNLLNAEIIAAAACIIRKAIYFARLKNKKRTLPTLVPCK